MINFDSIAPVHVVSDEYFIVKTEGMVSDQLIRFHLVEELMKHNIYTSFEFAVFNRSKGIMEKPTLITEKLEVKKSTYRFPLNSKFPEYFAVHFPNRGDYFNSRLSVWYFLSALLLLVLVFFGYTLFVIFRQRQLSEIQKNFINNLTHELKTPIASIGLSVNVLSDSKITENPARMAEYVRIIREQNQRLANNVEKVLNLASIEKNKLQLNLKRIELGEFMLETVNHFKQTAHGQKAGIELIWMSHLFEIEADTFHLSNLVHNILENAVKYCEKQPEIRIETVRKEKYLEIRFADNGIGIPREYRKQVFKRFFRVPTGNVHNVKGFGLGLDYVGKIVKAHKWKISVEENPKGGSIFILLIPWNYE
jgi:two-component system phosphate regulon sensor histidine kinase PhoR